MPRWLARLMGWWNARRAERWGHKYNAGRAYVFDEIDRYGPDLRQDVLVRLEYEADDWWTPNHPFNVGMADALNELELLEHLESRRL